MCSWLCEQQDSSRRSSSSTIKMRSERSSGAEFDLMMDGNADGKFSKRRIHVRKRKSTDSHSDAGSGGADEES